ncbi:polyhydroxyalkanoate synthase [Flexibacter flexilis DSM 6793]|uniref:Poly(3-hydroxyalkanoate) polymerase subunit PhaC n=1 Tax=Flexibacter flexilis DSM 6793 TaxID=927664 RepID=A0A1I1HBW4_9BACT|nr:class III poly(R)-hydroxyalkanoic acid synthase subunit PhaC [Flexibacter flexilis]SFC19478.1 polyhydroxyalkanoate synthase [Flexibacter flexilis DSM 6793]
MTTEPISNLLQEVADSASKVVRGYENLAQIDEVDVATAPREVVWQSGKIKLYRYKSEKVTLKTPLLIAYALVNRADMMDLQPDRSLIRNLVASGVDVYLIDWGYATRADRYNTMDDYINGFMLDCADYVRKTTGHDKINLLGVCQGGTFSTIFASHYPEKIKNLITMVTPVDFSIEEGLLFRWSRGLDVDAIVDGYGGVVPGDFLNFGFDMLKPMSKVRKMNGLVDMLQDKDKLLNFLRMEKWVADSPDQAGECYRQFLKDLYQQNKLMRGELVVGKKVNLKNINMPLLNIFAAEDHLVPPTASKPLNDLVSSTDKTMYEFPGGHIGVFVGNRSQKELAPTITKWLKERD